MDDVCSQMKEKQGASLDHKQVHLPLKPNVENGGKQRSEKMDKHQATEDLHPLTLQ